MSTTARLKRLEQSIQPAHEPIRVIRYIIDPNDGIVAVFDKHTNAQYRRDDQESADAFKARVDLALREPRDSSPTSDWITR